jgi:hypothetical protein
MNSALRFPLLWGEWGSTSANIPPNPGTVHIPALPSPVGGYQTIPFSEDPAILGAVGSLELYQAQCYQTDIA